MSGDEARPQPHYDDERLIKHEEEEAAREAGAIGGSAGDSYDVDEADRPLAEAGQGVSEGFELAEHDLIDAASHSRHAPDPSDMAGRVEQTDPGSVYGEADTEHVVDQ